MFRINHLLLWLVLFLVFPITSTYAGIPVLELAEGINPVTLQLQNVGSMDIQIERISIIEQDNGVDISLDGQSQLVTVFNSKAGTSGKVQLNFIVDLINQREQEARTIALKIEDAQGRKWDQPLILKIKKAAPTNFRLLPNYPNPFNAQTTISYDVPYDNNAVIIKIVNANGQKIRTLVHKRHATGRYSVIWDGKDNRSNLVASGNYLCVLEGENFKQVIKLTLIK